MRTEQSRSSDELPVLISLVIALGMLVATVVTMWMWTTVSGRMTTVDHGANILPASGSRARCLSFSSGHAHFICDPSRSSARCRV
jgi:hypothetical protein